MMNARRLAGLFGLLLALAGCATGRLPGQSPAESPTPTVHISPTPAASPTPTPSPVPTETPTPTPLPADLFDAGEAARKIGDWDGAVRVYQDLLTRNAVPGEVATQAVLRLAQVHMAAGAYPEAVELLEPLSEQAPDPGTRAAAHLLLGDALRAAGDGITATTHYSIALSAEPLLAPYVHEWIGDSLYENRVYTAAIPAYTFALSESLTTSHHAGLLEKLALSLAATGDYDGAMAAYDEILGLAQYAAYRARIMYQAAETARVFGDVDEAYGRMTELVGAYPTLPQAYAALVQLVDAGQPVDDMLRGLVDYHAEAYVPAVQAFDRVVQYDPDHDGAPHYYAGLAFWKAGSPELALEEWQVLIETHAGDPYVPDAWMSRATVLAEQGFLDTAKTAYETGLGLYEGRHELPQVVWTALDELEDAGAGAEVGEYLAELADLYPDDPGAPEARFRSGLLRYRTGNVAGAQRAWQALTQWYPYDDAAQAAWYWLGKTYLAADGATPTEDAASPAGLAATTGITHTWALSASQALSQAISLGPDDFYGLRAADLLAGRAPFAETPDPALISCTDEAAQAEAESWLENWLGLEAGSLSADLPATLLNDERLRRGTLLLDLGHFDEGRAELEQLRVETADDPLTQYRLSVFFRDIGLYRSSIIAAATVWQLSPAGELQALPRFLGCLAYPTYYGELVEPAATEHDLSPLFVYALLRQESLFEGYATSYAAAHGLMQVIPPTGEYIAQSLGWPPNYDTHDLYRPMVSVRFGVWYLAEQRGLTEGDLFVAMAAYNGGPGNAVRWWQEAEEDPDLFVELIGFEETRRYVRLIREHYAAYRLLYGEPDAPR